MSRTNLDLGKKGEEIAVDYLKNNGYKIVQRNFKNKLGEIDIVAKDRDTVCFIEVKTRTNLDFGYPKESVGAFKQKKLNKVALSYLKQYNLLNSKVRFDIVSIIINNPDKIDTFGGVQTSPSKAKKEHAALSINPKQTPDFSERYRRIDIEVIKNAF